MNGRSMLVLKLGKEHRQLLCENRSCNNGISNFVYSYEQAHDLGWRFVSQRHVPFSLPNEKLSGMNKWLHSDAKPLEAYCPECAKNLDVGR